MSNQLVKLNTILPGNIVEIFIYGLSGGNYYKVGRHSEGGKVICDERFTHRKVLLHPFNLCKIVNHLFRGENPQLEGFER